jgi:branched-chain amino acid transport system substrate-binding protein
LLLAPWGTPFHLAIAPVLEKFKFPMVGNTAASVALRQVKPGYIWFPTSAIPDRIGAELTAMLKTQNVKSVAVLSNVLPFTKEIKNFLEPELKKAGIAIKVSTEYPPDIADMTSTLTQIKQAGIHTRPTSPRYQETMLEIVERGRDTTGRVGDRDR